MKRLLWLALIIALYPMTVQAQGADLYGKRLASKDGQWLLPVATFHLGSTDDDHVGRGSINSWDLVAPKGTPVFAAAPGIIEAAGCHLYENGRWPIMQGYGCAVQIKHGNGISSQYGHCEGAPVVQPGQSVDYWTLLCTVGWTGKTSFGPHTHFTILRNGSPVRIDSVFDINQMYRDHLGSARTGQVIGQVGVAGNGVVSQAPSSVQAAIGQARIYDLLQSMADVPVEVWVWGYFFIFLVIGFVLWLGSNLLKMVTVGLLTGTVTAVIAIWLFVPPMTVVASQGVQPSQSVGGDVWEAAYGFMRDAEGSSCTHDPVRTFKGVTNSTYNAWRQSIGAVPGDVCTDMTDEQMKAIYHDLFWVKSGAYQLPPKVAIFQFDWYVNAGYGDGGSAKKALAACGTDLNCLVQRRLIFYQNCGTCSQGHFNRLNNIVKYLNSLGG